MEACVQSLLTPRRLERENTIHRGTPGVSAENRGYGFRPAFFDTQTQTIHEARFSDGTPAPFHLLDGLPSSLVLARGPSGRVVAVKPSVISGFVRDGLFYTRDEAARCVMPCAA